MTPNKQSKSILGRLLATENIMVVHDENARTAAFDIRNRVLTLPVLNNMSDELYDMIVGHEVGHALYTPYTDEDEKCIKEGKPLAAAVEIGGDDARLAMSYLNVVEDARIEKLMKEKFPGLRRDFLIGYKELHEKDFFEVAGKDIQDMSFIDRINLHYKIGTTISNYIKFSDEEMVFINEIDAARSYEEVVAVTKKIWDYCKNERKNQDGGNHPVVIAQIDSGIGNQNGNPSSNDDNNSKSNNDPDNYSHRGMKPHECSTDDAFLRNMGKLRNSTTRVNYAQLPKLVVDPVVDYTKIISYFVEPSKSCATEYAQAAAEYNEFASKSKKAVNILVKQFLMKKAATDSQRININRTGNLDTVKMVNYKFTDDIFRRMRVVKKGKSHGLVFFMDWSGSMSVCFGDTMRQLLQLVLFCRRMNIPFEVYGFTSVFDDYENIVENWQKVENPHANDIAYMHPFRLLNILSSRMNGNDFNTMMRNLFVQIMSYEHRFTNTSMKYYEVLPRCMELGSTPLNESILAGIDIVNKFRANNRLDIVHTVFLTDGESSGCGLFTSNSRYKNHIIYKNRVTQIKEDKSATDAFLEVFRNETGCRAIGIYLDSRKKSGLSHGVIHRYFGLGAGITPEQNKKFDDDGCISAPSKYHGYNELFIMKGNAEIEDDDFDDVLAGKKSNTGIRNAFMKVMENRISSRVMLNRFIDLIAVE